MRRKRRTVLLIGLLFLMFMQVPTAAAETFQQTTVCINNTDLTLGSAVIHTNGIIYVAAKELAEGLGGSFSYNTGLQQGTITAGGHELVFYLDSSVVCYNGKYIQADASMKIIKNRFMVPAGFAAGRLGAAYYLDQDGNTLFIYNPKNGRLNYTVQSGDTLWKISQIFSVPIATLRKNNSILQDIIYTGQSLFIRNLPASTISIPAYTTGGATVFSGASFSSTVKGYLSSGANITIRGKTGNWCAVDTTVGSGYLYSTVVGITQQKSAPSQSMYFSRDISVDTSGDSVTYTQYTVVSGDSVWSISQKYGIPDYELALVNGITAVTVLYPGQVIKIPVHHIALTSASTGQYGQVLDWYSQAQYVFPQGKTGKIIDPVTGKSFKVKRTMGSGHSDTETLTAEDTRIMKEIFGGTWSWVRKSFFLEVDGKRFAVSISGMPHAGVDGAAVYADVEGRSGDYGYGPNYDAIAGNGMDGHFDLYFLNCRRHVDSQIDPDHQYMVLVSGGLR